jgi:hypothetical protein
MDSGAYSAWKQGVHIDIDDYISYIRNNNIGKYISLDVVGDPELTQHNIDHMVSQGLYPVPVFHLGSEMKYLDQLVSDGYKYICLGGTVGASRNVRTAFFDECFARHPDAYYHGLGMTDPKLMLQYPWFSADSTTWLIGRKMCKLATMDGQVRLPRDMPIQERLALNVQFFRELERKSIL